MADGGHYPKIETHALARKVDPGHQRMWVGVFDPTMPQGLEWTIDGAPLLEDDVTPVRALSTMRPGPPDTQTHTGLFDLILPPRPRGADDRTRRQYTIGVRATWRGGRSEYAEHRVRPLPDEVPRGFDQSFKVMLVSCFYEPNDSAGRAGHLASMLARGLDPPDLVLCVGDQVYLDVPPWGSTKITETGFAKVFENKYRKNWQSGAKATSYADILRAAPVAGIPDDHEYWNNYPEWGKAWLSTWMSFTRENWAKAARAAYDAFQNGGKASGTSTYCYAFDVTPLCFFMLDNRTLREGTLERMNSMSRDDLTAFNDWVRHVLDTPGSVPVLVTGPSLFQGPKTERLRDDLNFANVTEYPAVMDGLARLSASGRNPLALTGDVHYPRVTKAEYPPGTTSRPWCAIHEVISSPTSLVMFGGTPTAAPHGRDRFDIDTQLKTNLRCEKLWPAGDIRDQHIGNQVAILKFTWMQTGLKLSVRYWLVPRDAKPTFLDGPEIYLRNAPEALQVAGSSAADKP